MPTIKINTEIKADVKIVFDLSRSIDLHIITTKHTNEKAIDGKTSGLIALNEQVTWQAKHFGITQKLTSKITEYNFPNYFVDEMVHGAFKMLRHKHIFTSTNDGCKMTDIFYYQSPMGILGKLADVLFLEKYLTKLLIRRNFIIKEFAESEKRKEILK